MPQAGRQDDVWSIQINGICPYRICGHEDLVLSSCCGGNGGLLTGANGQICDDTAMITVFDYDYLEIGIYILT
jgi:hypothetical protein